MSGTEASPWALPPDPPVLPAGEVHVWFIDLTQHSNQDAKWYAWLSGPEQERAERFHRDADRQRFILAHAALRDVLSRYLGIPPAQLTFQNNSYGKPSLAGNRLEFSLAHCQHLALVALSVERPVGVDVECPREGFDPLPVARRFFSPGEVAALEIAPPERHMEAFLNAWTRKEAYIKAQGLGLSLPLDSFEVSLLPGSPARLVWVQDEPAAPGRWSLHALQTAYGCTAALAVEGPVDRLRQFHWIDRR